MKGLRVYASVILLAMLMSVPACGKKEDESAREAKTYSEPRGQASAEGARGNRKEVRAAQASTEAILLNDVLALWESGNEDDAVRQFLSIRWDEPAVFANMPTMSLSEAQFVSLSQGERTRIQEEAMELIATLRKMVKHILSEGERALASGDKQTAKTHYEAVVQCGQALSGPERLALIQMSGKAIAKAAQSKLTRVQ